MEDFRKSLYAINKVSKNIVYKNADGSYLEVTFEKVAAENPNFTAEDFAKLKELSDELFHDEAKGDDVYYKHVTSDLNDNLNSDWAATSALEDELVKAEDELISAENKKQLVMMIQEVIDKVLSTTQRRRFLMHFAEGMTVTEIARIENCALNTVKESIGCAWRKIMDNM